MKMKKIWAILLTTAMVFSLCACGNNQKKEQETDTGSASSKEASEDKIKISIATPCADGNPMMDLVYYWQEQVDEILPGRVEWETYPNSTMGSEREIGEMVMDGTLSGALVGPSNITAFAPMQAVRLQDMPFLFKDGDELYAAGEEWMNEAINKECESYGLTTIFYEYIMGQEIENTKRPIYTPDDVKGLKIRVYDSPGPYNFLEACGGLPVAMAFSEVYTGVQQGAIDGLYTTTSNFVPQKFTEVCKYHTKLTITNLGMTMLFNLDTLNSYPQDLQDAMKEAGKRTEKYCQEVVSPDTKTKTYDDIAAAGVEINEVTEEQYQVFADQVSDYCYEKLREDVGSELWDKCINWLEEYRAR